MPNPTARAASPGLALRLAIAALVIVLPWAFFGYMAGDAVIHLVFAENGLRGDWLAFNPGERSGGETSFGYMLAVMALWQAIGQAWTPYAMIALCYAAWLASLYAGWKLVDDWYPRSWWPWFWLLITGTMPGSVFNSVLGMENVLLAPVTMGLLWCLYRLDGLVRPLPVTAELAIAAGLGLTTWLRPEALFLAAGLYAWRLFVMSWHVPWHHALLRGVVSGGIVVTLFASLCLVFWRLSGLMPFSGGVARLNMSASEGLVLGGVLPLHAKLAGRMLAYFPLTTLFALGVYRWASTPSGMLAHRGVPGLAIALVVWFAGLYSTILPTAHLARYTIFFWPLVTLVAAYGIAESWNSWPARLTAPGVRLLALTLSAALVTIYGYEFALRRDMLRGQHLLSAVRHARDRRVAATDALLQELHCIGPYPVSVGFIEVQMRYFFDDRILVRTMDGIIDNEFNAFVTRTPLGVVYDYTGYFKKKRLDYIAEYLDLNPAADDWSPAILNALPVGTVMDHDGIRFERLPGRITRLTYPDVLPPL